LESKVSFGRKGQFIRVRLYRPVSRAYKWAGEYEFEQRAKERLKIILPIVFFVIFVLLYMVFHSVTESAVLIFPTIYALTGGLILQKLLGYNFSVAVWVGYIALFGIAVETGVVMVVYLHEALDRRLASGRALKHEDIEEAAIEGAVHRLRPKLMTVCVVRASLIPILWESGVGSDVMKPIAAPIVGGMITSTIHVLILVPVFFALGYRSPEEPTARTGSKESSNEGRPGRTSTRRWVSSSGPIPTKRTEI
jgi:copper/silver efflux system protein